MDLIESMNQPSSSRLDVAIVLAGCRYGADSEIDMLMETR